MRRLHSAIIAATVFTAASVSAGPLRVVAAYPYIGDIVEKIGGDKVTVFTLARGDYNPHGIIPRPSYIAQIRRADLVIINGAQLEIGWMPPLLRQASNPAVQTGEAGFLDLSRCVSLIDVPRSVSRELGDMHPEGNPHFYLDPENILPLAGAIRDRLVRLDAQNAATYNIRYNEFSTMWKKKLEEWSHRMASLSGTRVVEYHEIFNYFLHRYGLKIAGTVESLPGIPPTSRHIERLEATLHEAPAPLLLQDVYNPDDASIRLAGQMRMKLLVLPHDVGAVKEARDIVALFDELVRRIAP